MRKLIIILLCCTGVLLGGYAGYRAYKVWKLAHLVEIGRDYMEQGDARNAELSFRQALQVNPVNLEATRLMAELTESTGNPAAILWRARVVELDPGSVEDRLGLARLAWRQQDLAAATNALAAIPDSGRNSAEYHNVAGAVAGVMGQTPEAEAHFRQAVQLEPTNEMARLNLAVAQLQGTNQVAFSGARTALRELSGRPAVRQRAIRELIADAIRHQRTNDAVGLAQQLVAATNAAFADRIVQLGVLQYAGRPELRNAVEACKRDAGGEPESISALANWMLPNLGPAELLGWVESLPTSTRTNQPTAMIEASCRSGLKDWGNLEGVLKKQNWAELDFVRSAYLSRALRGLGQEAAAKTAWEQALQGAASRRQPLIMLLALATQWGLQTEGEGILWAITSRYPADRWAFDALSRILYAGGRTRQLMTLYSQESRRRQDDLSLKNNFAMTALLLDAQEYNPHDVAAEVYRQSPTNSNYASTYALSLHLRKKNAEALEVMSKLPPEVLEQPGMAGYYGIILKANGRPGEATKFLNLATNATLLPEERRLIETARSAP